MGLLSKLFCKEEPTAAPEPSPVLPADERPEYIPFGATHYRTEATCVRCAKVEIIDRYGGKSGWKVFNGFCGKPQGVIACPDCSPEVQRWVLKSKADNLARDRQQHHNRHDAYKAQHAWDALHPRPHPNTKNSTFVFVRRTTCGECGKVEEIEGPQHKLPSWPEGWRQISEYRGPMVCPDCYEKFAPFREELAQWKKDRDTWVGGFFRAADLGLPPVVELRLPDRWR